MTTQEVADTLVTLCTKGQFEDAMKTLYSPEIVSIEAFALGLNGSNALRLTRGTGRRDSLDADDLG